MYNTLQVSTQVTGYFNSSNNVHTKYAFQPVNCWDQPIKSVQVLQERNLGKRFTVQDKISSTKSTDVNLVGYGMLVGMLILLAKRLLVKVHALYLYTSHVLKFI